jgi:hypothetical protein
MLHFHLTCLNPNQLDFGLRLPYVSSKKSPSSPAVSVFLDAVVSASTSSACCGSSPSLYWPSQPLVSRRTSLETCRSSRTRATCWRTSSALVRHVLLRCGLDQALLDQPGHPGLGEPVHGRLLEGKLLGRVTVLVGEQDLPDRGVDDDHHRFGHHPDRHRTGGLADHRFFRRGFVMALYSTMLIVLNRRALPDEIRLKSWRLLIIIITACSSSPSRCSCSSR